MVKLESRFMAMTTKEKSTMTIIGQRTGGGECVVGQYGYGNASGVIFHTSGQFHLGYYDKVTQQFVGDDAGIEPDYQLDVNKFYNNSELVNFINSLQKIDDKIKRWSSGHLFIIYPRFDGDFI